MSLHRQLFASFWGGAGSVLCMYMIVAFSVCIDMLVMYLPTYPTLYLLADWHLGGWLLCCVLHDGLGDVVVDWWNQVTSCLLFPGDVGGV